MAAEATSADGGRGSGEEWSRFVVLECADAVADTHYALADFYSRRTLLFSHPSFVPHSLVRVRGFVDSCLRSMRVVPASSSVIPGVSHRQFSSLCEADSSSSSSSAPRTRLAEVVARHEWRSSTNGRVVHIIQPLVYQQYVSGFGAFLCSFDCLFRLMCFFVSPLPVLRRACGYYALQNTIAILRAISDERADRALRFIVDHSFNA